MKKSLIIATGIFAAACGWYALAQNPESTASVPMQAAKVAADYDPHFYGVLSESDTWNNNGNYILQSGVYDFTLSPFTNFTLKSEASTTLMVTHGGFHANGYFYYLCGEVTSKSFNMTFNKRDVTTWRKVDQSGHMAPSNTVAYDLTYDYTTSTAYAASPVNAYSKTTMGNAKTVLRTVDLESGNFTDVAPLDDKIRAIACDGTGQLWGIARETQYPYAGSLYKINKTDGTCTLVGNLGLQFKNENVTSTFDLRTGKLYITCRAFTFNDHYEETYFDGIYEVNLTNGSADPMKSFDTSERLSTLFMIDTHPKAPAELTDLKFDYNSGSTTEGVASLTLPTETFDGNTLNGNLEVTVYNDGVEIARASGLNPGATYRSPKITLTSGNHTLKAVCSNSIGSSLPTSVTFHAGTDTPAAVTDLKVATTRLGNIATIAWKAPQKGVNGGYIDVSKLTYNVRRRPDNVMVATGITATTFSDTPGRKMGVTQYEVTPVIEGVAGTPANTPTIIVGDPHAIPYLETFDNITNFYGYTTIDANSDGSEEGNVWMFYPNYREAVWWLNYATNGKADDWMITPTMELKNNMVYRLAFDTHGYSSGSSTCRFQIYTGNAATVAGMTELIFDESFTAPKQNSPRRFNALFNPPSGHNRIGFHATNDGNDHVALDNIRVIEYGPVSIPQAPVATAEKENGNVKFTVTLPTQAVDGTPLGSLQTVWVYRENNATAAKLDNPRPGSTVTLTDTEPSYGVNNYIVVAENAAGEGLETAVSINLIPVAPNMVSDVRTKGDGSEITLEWDHLLFGVDGSKLRPQDITFNVYRQENYLNKIASGLKEMKFTDTTADLLLGGALQKQITYYIEAQTDGGTSQRVEANEVVGRTLELPYTEKCDGNGYNWFGSQRLTNSGYSPLCKEGASDTHFMMFYNNQGTITSPRLNFTGLVNPRMSLWIYHTDDTKYNRTSIGFRMETTDKDGYTVSSTVLPEKFTTAQGTGWVKHEVDLSAYANCARASIVIICNSAGGYIHMDDFEFTGDRPAKDLRVLSLNGPKRAYTGRTNIYTATVDNNGTSESKNFKIEFKADDEIIESRTASLASGANSEYTFEYTPDITHPEIERYLSIAVTPADGVDNSPANNEARMKVEHYAPDVPYIHTLKGEWDLDGVELSWNDATAYPHNISITDDIESYSNFIVENIGNWKLYDGDGAPTLNGIANSYGTYTWSNCGTPQSWIVFNPKNAGVETLATPYSGTRCLVSFVSGAGQNDDWLISPMLLGGEQTISFYARAMHPSYTQERLEVYASTAGNDIEDFTEMLSRYTVNSSVWRQYNVKLPAGTRYFALRCTSANQFALMLDNICYVPAQSPVDLYGFNVYRDGVRIATEHGENSFRDESGDLHRHYDYNVTAVYDSGESIYSNTVRAGRTALADATASGIEINAVDGAVEVSGANGDIITVCTVDGALIASFRATAFERIPLAKGIYVIKAGAKTAKLQI